jgi:signal transduction histidine kinase
LGSDLHDGVGHQLAALARQVERAVHQLDHDPETIRKSLAAITDELNAAIAQVRVLAHQLHPPELELLGFIGVLHEHAQTHPSLIIHLDAPDCLPSLPTAVETAAYYILLEALTNIEKHARARTCAVRVALTQGGSAFDAPMLELDIQDDGEGLPDAQPRGLGLLSMQARAVEVGGMCRIESKACQGTKVSVRLPCSVPLSPDLETTEA